MDSLPNEILCEIISYTPHDYYNLLRVSKQFASIIASSKQLRVVNTVCNDPQPLLAFITHKYRLKIYEYVWNYYDAYLDNKDIIIRLDCGVVLKISFPRSIYGKYGCDWTLITRDAFTSIGCNNQYCICRIEIHHIIKYFNKYSKALRLLKNHLHL